MKALYLFTALCVNLSVFGQHTFSIVAVDPITGEIGSAGATCISSQDGAQDISAIVLGVGAIHTQSFWDPTNQSNATARMIAGDSPQEIIDWLLTNDVNNDPSARQYNIVDLNSGNPRSAAYTGPSCFAEFIHIEGPNYAIAGNILISEDVVNDMETAFVNTAGTLADKLMAALQGAKRPGADSRCLSNGISSASAFLRVADPLDTDSSYGNLSLDLNVWITTTIFEPIDALQDLYDATLGVTDNTSEAPQILLYPNPAEETVTIQSNSMVLTGYEVIDINGKVITHRTTEATSNKILLDVVNYAKGVYFVSVYENGNKLTTEKLVVQ